MPLQYNSGFKVFDGTTLIIESGRVHECMAFFNRSEFLKTIWISKFHGYTDPEMSFLEKYPFVTKVIINGPYDASGLYALKDLEFLSYENYDKTQKLDLSNFKELKTCYLDLSSKIAGLGSLSKVEDIRLFNYSTKERDLTGLSGLKSLRYLFMSVSNAHSLDGVEELKHLKCVDLNYFRSLTDISSIAKLKDTLTTLSVNDSKKMERFGETASKLKGLDTLIFVNDGSVPSLGFFKEMPKLKDARFLNTAVIDGDMTPCIGLEYAAFSNKRHYSHTMEQITEINAKKG